MGISTPKPAFNLAEFLSQKAPAGARRKPAWNRPRSAAPMQDDAADDTAEDGADEARGAIKE